MATYPDASHERSGVDLDDFWPVNMASSPLPRAICCFIAVLLLSEPLHVTFPRHSVSLCACYDLRLRGDERSKILGFVTAGFPVAAVLL